MKHVIAINKKKKKRNNFPDNRIEFGVLIIISGGERLLWIYLIFKMLKIENPLYSFSKMLLRIFLI